MFQLPSSGCVRGVQVALAALIGGLLSHGTYADSLLLRHKIATISTANLDRVARLYDHWLDYKVRERGRVSADLAASWGAPKTAGKAYILLSADAAPDVYIRAVQGPAVRDYHPMTTFGWNAIEIIVEAPDELRERLRNSPFKVLGEPKPLGGYPSIRAFQVQGPDGEVLYLTAETGDRTKSILPSPGGPVGRVFIMVVAGPDIEKQLAWFSSSFDMARGTVRMRSVGVLRRAQSLMADELLPLTTLRLAQPGNLIELDGYSAKAGPRGSAKGKLPPGVAMASFTVRSLEALHIPFITPPAVHAGIGYAGHRSATARGPVGELVELIEE